MYLNELLKLSRFNEAAARLFLLLEMKYFICNFAHESNRRVHFESIVENDEAYFAKRSFVQRYLWHLLQIEAF